MSTQCLDWLHDMSINSVDQHVLGSVNAPLLVTLMPIEVARMFCGDIKIDRKLMEHTSYNPKNNSW